QQILKVHKYIALYRKMAPVEKWMNIFSLPLHAVWAMVINLIIESISRHSVFAAWKYMVETPLVFLYNAFMIFVTFSIVYLFRRMVFVRIFICVFWLVLGVVNVVMLLRRVTRFNAVDLKALLEAL